MTELPVITLLEPIHESGTQLLRQHSVLHELSGPSDPNLRASLQESEGLIVRSTTVGADLLALAPKLRVIGRHGAGIDNIDQDAAADRGIRIVNTPRSNTNSVAEYVIAVMFALAKRTSEVESALRSGAFSADEGSLPGQVQRAGLAGREIAGSHLGLIGAGAIGQSVAQKAQALGMRVSAVDPFLPDHVWESLDINRVASITELLPQVDVVSVHIPGGEAPVLTANLLALLPSHAFVINAARGGVIDEPALAHALETGQIAGAAVDVFSIEPPPSSSPLLSAPRAIVTPHMAAMTAESLHRMGYDVARATLDALVITSASSAAKGNHS